MEASNHAEKMAFSPQNCYASTLSVHFLLIYLAQQPLSPRIASTTSTEYTQSLYIGVNVNHDNLIYYN